MQTIILPDHCERGAVAAIHPQIAAAIDAGAVTIDASALTHGGQALLQLLLSAQRTAQARGKAFAVRGSDVLAEIVNIAGLAAELRVDAA